MKTLSTLAVITAFASTAAFAAGEQPAAPIFTPAFAPAFAPMAQPTYVADMRADFEKRAAAMRAEIEQRSAAARTEIEAMLKQARATAPAGFNTPAFPTAPAFATPNADMVKAMEEQRAAAEKRMEEMRKAMPAAPQFQAPQFQAPRFAAPVASVDTAEMNKRWEEQAKAFAAQRAAAYEQFQVQMKAQQEARAKQFAQIPAAPQAPVFQAPTFQTPAFAPMDQSAMMAQMEAQRAAAEKMMQEARTRMEEMQSRTL